MRWKALDEIYKICMLLHRSDLIILAIVRRFFGVFNIRNAKKFDFPRFSTDFIVIFADFVFALNFSDFLKKRCNYSKFLDFDLIFA